MAIQTVKLYNLIHITQILTTKTPENKAVKLTIEFNSYSKMSPFVHTFSSDEDLDKFLGHLKKSHEAHMLFDPYHIIKSYKIK